MMCSSMKLFGYRQRLQRRAISPATIFLVLLCVPFPSHGLQPSGSKFRGSGAAFGIEPTKHSQHAPVDGSYISELVRTSEEEDEDHAEYGRGDGPSGSSGLYDPSVHIGEGPAAAVVPRKQQRARLNLRPMVGVLTHPFRPPGSRFHDLVKKNGSFIAASYVKMLQAGGAMVAPVFFDAPEEVLKKVFTKINMLVIPGGWASLEPGSPWHRASRILLDLALNENDRGEHFAIHGTCRGFEMLSILVAGGHHVLENCNSEAYPTTTRFVSRFAKKRAMFAWMDEEVIDAMESKNIAMHNHKKGIKAHRFDDNQDLSSFFEVLTTSLDRKGKEFVSTMQAYRYPITGTSWHGEKSGLEWFSTRNVPRGQKALQIMQATGNFLASEARKSSHVRDSMQEEANMVIANFPIIFDADKRHRTYDEVYQLPPFEDWISSHHAKLLAEAA